MKRASIWFVGIVSLLVVLGVGASRVPAIQDALLQRLVGGMVDSSGPVSSEDSGLGIVFCGTGGPFADIDRAGPCTLVIAGSERFLVDTGTGGVQRLQQNRITLGELKAVFVTHLHSDHISGLGDVLLNSWAGGRKEPLTLFGPPGVEDLGRGFERAFLVDSKSRIDHHGSEIFAPAAQFVVPATVELVGRDEDRIIYNNGDLQVTAFRVNHEPLADAYGYRFDYKGRSVVFSGDTVKDDNMVRFGSGADVMVHEAMSMINVGTMIDALEESGADAAKILRDASEVHTSPREAAEIANEADVQLLVFNHIVPPMPIGLLEDRFMRGVSDIRASGVMLGHDGLMIRLPANSTDVEIHPVN